MTHDIVIVGGGCAGISAAIYAASRNKKTLLIEQESKLGGEIRQISTITHFAGAFDGEGGPSLAERMIEQLSRYAVDIVSGTVTSAVLKGAEKRIVASSGEYIAKSVITAAGTTQRDLPVLAAACSSGYVSHCALRDAARYAGKDVFVLGGSDGAAKEALYLSTMAKNVFMVMIEKKLAATPQFAERIAASPNIQVVADSSVKTVIGDDSLHALEIENNTTGETRMMEAPGGCVFVYIGSFPNTHWCHETTLENGYVITDETMLTDVPNVFAAGDIRVKTVRQISTAVSDGTIAAIHACASLG